MTLYEAFVDELDKLAIRYTGPLVKYPAMRPVKPKRQEKILKKLKKMRNAQ